MELEQRLRPHLRPTNGSWWVNETYIKVKGRYLYRAVDSCGQTIDFRLAPSTMLQPPSAPSASRLTSKALARPNTVNPRTITVDKNAALSQGGGRHEEGQAALALL